MLKLVTNIALIVEEQANYVYFVKKVHNYFLCSQF